MIKLVISGGDSFTYGAELPNDHLGPSNFVWSNLIAKKLNAKHVNTAASGRGNSFISRRIIYNATMALEKYNPEDIFVQIMWTHSDRREFKLIDGILNNLIYRIDGEWLALDPHAVVDESKSDWFLEIDSNSPNYEDAKKDLKEKYIIYKNAGVVDFGKHWYKIISDEDDIFSSLKDIIIVQEFLKNRNIRYIFSYIERGIYKQLFEQDSNTYIETFRSFIDKTSWFHFPGDQEYMGFDNWAHINNYEYATSHPLEKAHSDAAELIYENIKKIL